MFIKKTAIAIMAIALMSLTGFAAGDSRIKIFTKDATSLRHTLEKAGYDILGHNRSEGSVELIASSKEMTQLRNRGYDIRTVKSSRGVPPGYRDYNALVPLYLQAQFKYPGICQVIDAGAVYGNGNTSENRTIYLIKISDNVKTDEDEPGVLLTFDLHAREIATAEYAVWLLEKLTTLYGSDPDVTRWVDENQIYIMPCMNPDGYQYCHDVDEWWRKNRTPFGGGDYGVDLNRNFDFQWNGPHGGSSDPGSVVHRGPAPNSEQETKAQVGFALDRGVLAKMMDFHSYGREVLYTYPESSDFPPALESYMKTMAETIAHGFNYNGDHRKPSASGESYEWQLCKICPFAFLVETGDSFHPDYADAKKEFDDHIWPGIQAFLDLKITFTGRVKETKTGTPLQADLAIQGINYTEGEVRRSESRFGRYFYALPQGKRNVTFSASGYAPRTVSADGIKNQSSLLSTQLGDDPVLTVKGVNRLGGLLNLAFDWKGGPGHLYGNGISLLNTGFNFPNGVHVPVGWDLIYQITLGLFPGWSGTLNANGQAQASLPIPNDPAAAGLVLYMGYFTMDPVSMAPSAASIGVTIPIHP